MADPILMFPRVVIKHVDPTVSDDKTLGYIDGNVWINKETNTLFVCVDASTGTWITLLASGSIAGGGNFSFGDGSLSNVDFDLGDGEFKVNAGNIDITKAGEIHLKGGRLVFYSEREGEPLDEEHTIVKVERGEEPDAFIKWNEVSHSWVSGVTDPDPNEHYMFPIVTVVRKSRDPLPEDYKGYYIGQTWINSVTEQKFTCVSRDNVNELSFWRLALTTAPTKFMVEYDDYIILYGHNDDTFMKISANDFASWIADVVGGLGTSTAGYAWILDAVDNITMSDEITIDNGLFEQDGNGDMQPIEGSDADVFFELDTNDDVMPRAA